MELFVTLCVVLQILGLPVSEAQQFPDQVSSLHATAVSPTSVHVTWLPGNWGNKGDSGVLGYRLEYTDQASDLHLLQLASLSGGHVLTSLKPDTEYTISVSAYNRYGNSEKSYVRVRTLKDPSADERPHQVPPPVSHLNAVATTSTSVTVTWSPGNGNIPVEGYKVGYGAGISDVSQTTLPADARSVDLEKLEPDTEYAISIRAYNEVGYSRTTYAVVRTPDNQSVPPPVSRLNAVATTSTSVTVTWSPGNGSIPVEGYKVGYGAGISDVSQMTLSADARSVDLENLEADTEYAISLRAYNKVGYSRTTYAVVRTPDNQSVPPPVSRLNAVATTSTSVTVTWSPGNGNIPVEGYKVGYGAGISDVSQMTLPADARSVDLKNLEPDTEIAISIRAYNEVGYSRTTYAVVRTPDNQSGFFYTPNSCASPTELSGGKHLGSVCVSIDVKELASPDTVAPTNPSASLHNMHTCATAFFLFQP